MNERPENWAVREGERTVSRHSWVNVVRLQRTPDCQVDSYVPASAHLRLDVQVCAYVGDGSAGRSGTWLPSIQVRRARARAVRRDGVPPWPRRDSCTAQG